VWRDHQPSHLLCTDAMEAAGLRVRITINARRYAVATSVSPTFGVRLSCGCVPAQVEVVQVDYTVRMPKARWYSMVRARFWSTFSHFTDAELEEGLEELERLHRVRATANVP
jgi:hypothetical protein